MNKTQFLPSSGYNLVETHSSEQLYTMQWPKTFLSTLSYLNSGQIQLKNHRWQIFYFYWQFSVQFSYSVMSDSLQPHGLQHSRPSCPSPTPGVYSNSCPLSQWYHSTICHLLLHLPSILPSIRVFSNESVLCIMWPKYFFNHFDFFNYFQLMESEFAYCSLPISWKLVKKSKWLERKKNSGNKLIPWQKLLS